MNLKELLNPNKIKLTLFLCIAIPCITLIITVFGYNYLYPEYEYFTSSFILVDPLIFLISISFFILGGLLLSYILGSIIDYYIQNKNLKMFIALTSGLISIIIIYIMYKMITEPIICDPVHLPNQTISDPVHETSVSENYHNQVLKEIQVDMDAVEDSFARCIQGLKP